MKVPEFMLFTLVKGIFKKRDTMDTGPSGSTTSGATAESPSLAVTTVDHNGDSQQGSVIFVEPKQVVNKIGKTYCYLIMCIINGKSEVIVNFSLCLCFYSFN